MLGPWYGLTLGRVLGDSQITHRLLPDNMLSKGKLQAIYIEKAAFLTEACFILALCSFSFEQRMYRILRKSSNSNTPSLSIFSTFCLDGPQISEICLKLIGWQSFLVRFPAFAFFSTFCLDTTLRQAKGGAKRSRPTRPSSSLRMPLRALGRLGCCSTPHDL